MTATHLCLVSDQPVPSLTPLLDPALAVRQVILVHAPERARYLNLKIIEREHLSDLAAALAAAIA